MRGLCLMTLCAAAAAAELPAFPGAEGFGALTPGGRGGKVLVVATLNDSGPGSLRAAVEAEGPRTVIFGVGGLIDLQKPLIIRSPYITIAGQTAPGDGICLRRSPLAVETHDVIIRFIRSRLGDLAGKEYDAIAIGGQSWNVILDHVSASWSVDESLSPSGDIGNITVQWSIIAESLNKSVHAKGKHGYGSLVRATGGVSLHHNLWAFHTARNPRLGDNYFKGGEPTHDVRNNVMYGFAPTCTGMVDGRIKVNYVGNYIKPGPQSNPQTAPIALTENANELTRFFLSGNFMAQRPDLTMDNSQMFQRQERDGKRLVTVVGQPFDAPAVTAMSARKAYEAVLGEAGCTRPRRDAVDERIVAAVRDGTGGIIDSQGQVGGWPEYRGGQAPKPPANAAARHASGYTNLEVWLSELAGKVIQK